MKRDPFGAQDLRVQNPRLGGLQPGDGNWEGGGRVAVSGQRPAATAVSGFFMTSNRSPGQTMAHTLPTTSSTGT